MILIGTELLLTIISARANVMATSGLVVVVLCSLIGLIIQVCFSIRFILITTSLRVRLTSVLRFAAS